MITHRSYLREDDCVHFSIGDEAKRAGIDLLLPEDLLDSIRAALEAHKDQIQRRRAARLAGVDLATAPRIDEGDRATVQTRLDALERVQEHAHHAHRAIQDWYNSCSPREQIAFVYPILRLAEELDNLTTGITGALRAVLAASPRSSR